MIWTLELPGYFPTPLNRLVGCHFGTRARLKRHDRDVLAVACLAYQVPPSDSRRRVSLTVVLPKGRRAVDPDALWKSTLDALVQCRVLRNDSAAWVELGPVRFCRGEVLTTFVTLEDVRP